MWHKSYPQNYLGNFIGICYHLLHGGCVKYVAFGPPHKRYENINQTNE